MDRNKNRSKYEVVVEQGENVAIGDSAQANGSTAKARCLVLSVIAGLLAVLVCGSIAVLSAFLLRKALYASASPFNVEIDGPRNVSLCRFAIKDTGDTSAGIYAFVGLSYCVHGRGEHRYEPEDAYSMTYVVGPIVHSGEQGEVYAITLVLDKFEEPQPPVSPVFVYPECGGFGSPGGTIVDLNEVLIHNDQQEIPVLDAPYPLAQDETVSFRIPLRFVDPGTYTFHFEILARESVGTRFRVTTDQETFTWKAMDADFSDLQMLEGYGPEIQLCND